MHSHTHTVKFNRQTLYKYKYIYNENIFSSTWKSKLHEITFYFEAQWLSHFVTFVYEHLLMEERESVIKSQKQLRDHSAAFFSASLLYSFGRRFDFSNLDGFRRPLVVLSFEFLFIRAFSG